MKIAKYETSLMDEQWALLESMFPQTKSAASRSKREEAKEMLGRVLACFTCLRLLWVDGGYAGDNSAHWVSDLRPNLEVEVVKRSDDTAGFKARLHPDKHLAINKVPVKENTYA